MSTAPTVCIYCRGTGEAPGEGPTTCGFCDGGVPLDTQEDWDRTWGRILCAESCAERPCNEPGVTRVPAPDLPKPL